MDKVSVLCAMNRFMMREFSQRTAAGLKDYKLFRLFLPPFQSFLDINVRKEVEKDQLVISSAAAAQKAGREPDDADAKRLLQKAREIDQAFLRQASLFPIAINIRYSDIEQIRQKRIEQLLETTYRLFAQWEDTPRFRVAVSGLYSHEQFRALLREMLRLYGMETKLLSNSVRIPHLFTMARDSLSQTVYAVMERAAEELARELAYKVYRRIS